LSTPIERIETRIPEWESCYLDAAPWLLLAAVSHFQGKIVEAAN
jgi:hypothetical protein